MVGCIHHYPVERDLGRLRNSEMFPPRNCTGIVSGVFTSQRAVFVQFDVNPLPGRRAVNGHGKTVPEKGDEYTPEMELRRTARMVAEFSGSGGGAVAKAGSGTADDASGLAANTPGTPHVSFYVVGGAHQRPLLRTALTEAGYGLLALMPGPFQLGRALTFEVYENTDAAKPPVLVALVHHFCCAWFP
jgi:hypothetical protein